MDDADHWWDSWNNRPMWLDILVLWLSIGLLVSLVVCQRIIRDWRTERHPEPDTTGHQNMSAQRNGPKRADKGSDP